MIETEERKIDIHTQFIFAPHTDPEDLNEVEKAIEWADIYVPESTGHDSYTTKVYQMVADGLMMPPVNLPPFETAELKMLYRFGRGKRIFILDIPLDSPSFQAHTNFKPYVLNFSNTYEATIEGIKNSIQSYTKTVLIPKEEHIIKGIRERINQDLSKNLYLRKKKELNVLIFLGAVHTNVFIQSKSHLDNEGSASRSFPGPMYIFDYESQAQREQIFNGHINDSTIEYVVLQKLLMDLWYSKNPYQTVPTERLSRKFRRAAAQFKPIDIKSLYQEIRRESLAADEEIRNLSRLKTPRVRESRKTQIEKAFYEKQREILESFINRKLI